MNIAEIWLTRYILIALQSSRVKEEPRYKVKNLNTRQMFRRPLFLYRILHLSKSGCLQNPGEEGEKKVNYNSQFSSILKPTAGLADHRTLVPAEKLAQFVKYLKSNFALQARKRTLVAIFLLLPAELLFLK